MITTPFWLLCIYVLSYFKTATPHQSPALCLVTASPRGEAESKPYCIHTFVLCIERIQKSLLLEEKGDRLGGG